MSKLQAAIFAGLIFIVVLVMGLASVEHYTQKNGRSEITPTVFRTGLLDWAGR